MKAKNASVLLIVVLIGILVSAVLYYNFSPSEIFWRTKINDVKSHELAWSQQGISKYAIGVHLWLEYLSYPGGTTFYCSQQLVVDHNKIVETIIDACPTTSSARLHTFLTVDTLFSMIENKVASRRCDPEGCKCGVLVVDVVYDSKYKYPKTAKTYYSGYSGEAAGIFRDPNSFCVGTGGNATEGIRLETYYFKSLEDDQ